MIFELWDTEMGNIVGAYDREDEALAVVHRATAAYGEQYADTLALLCEDDLGDVTTLAAGSALASRAHAAMTTPIG